MSIPKKSLNKGFYSPKKVTPHKTKSPICETTLKYTTISRAHFGYHPQSESKNPSSPPTSGSNAVKSKDK